VVFFVRLDGVLTLGEMDHVLGRGSLWLVVKEYLDGGVVKAAVVA
jgi:hypothetical protein